ncbi:MAG: chemotaxis protein CheB [Aquabacterium sp.]|nr:MAG: chemotaxis protein CheB [Aquabacterium sp.]
MTALVPGWQARISAVVIGGSAGCVDALATLLPRLPRDLCAAVLAVVHLPRERPSLLVDIFRERSALPLCEAQDKEPIAPGTVYFAPPDYHLLVDEGPRLALSIDDPVHFSRPSIDVLFESAADIYGPQLLGILLTGGNADGAQGLQAVHRNGGVTVVQDPDDAMVRYMPAAALQLEPADFVLPLDGIARLLATLADRGAT